MIRVSPSILSADFANLERDIRKVCDAGADLIHVDVMDGHFVPNLSIGAPVVSAISKFCTVPLDVHLMIDRPDVYVGDFILAKSNIITIHLESPCDIKNTLTRIKDSGVKAGLSIKPGTPFSAAIPYMDSIDMLLIMTVEPGFGGQSFMADMLPKIKEARDYIDQNNLPVEIEIDGGLSDKTIGPALEAGAEIIVAGSYVFGAADMHAAIDSLRG